MDYEKKYKDANDKVAARFGTNVAKEIFTDLYESEDEKIRKTLIEYFNAYPKDYYGELKKSHILAWIEKQDPKKHEEELEKAYKCADEVQYRKGYEDAKREIEKQSEQKPADNVEPKFKVGDFIANDYCFGKVIALTNDAYLLDTKQGIPFSCEHNAHLWTIQDAKDGDVLVTNSNIIFIFKYLDEGGTIAFRASCTENSGVYFPKIKERLCDQDANPATKEQRDLLFQKMKETGYEWSDKDRKLIKIVK